MSRRSGSIATAGRPNRRSPDSFAGQVPTENDRSQHGQRGGECLREPVADRPAELLDEEDGERRQQHYPGRPGQGREQANDAGHQPLTPARVEQGRRDQEKEERFGVDGGEEERGWEEGNRPHRAPRDLRIEIQRDQPVEEVEGEEERHVGDQVADRLGGPAGELRAELHQPRIERPERGVRGVRCGVALVGDGCVPGAVPVPERFHQPTRQATERWQVHAPGAGIRPVFPESLDRAVVVGECGGDLGQHPVRHPDQRRECPGIGHRLARPAVPCLSRGLDRVELHGIAAQDGPSLARRRGGKWKMHRTSPTSRTLA